jgi:uncharacterized protein (DUF433 family)
VVEALAIRGLPTRYHPHMDWREHITVDASVMTGKPVVRGTRITVETVVDLLARGYAVPDVLKQHPHLAEADVLACLAYARDVLKGERVSVTP